MCTSLSYAVVTVDCTTYFIITVPVTPIEKFPKLEAFHFLKLRSNCATAFI